MFIGRVMPLSIITCPYLHNRISCFKLIYIYNVNKIKLIVRYTEMIYERLLMEIFDD